MKAFLITVLLGVALVLGGCTMTETAEQRNRRHRQIADLQYRMMMEDIDAVLLLDRASDLSEWSVHIED